MAVAIGGHLDRGVSESSLHDLKAKLEPAIDFSIDAPTRRKRRGECRPVYSAFTIG
jgi:hypothetical protein